MKLVLLHRAIKLNRERKYRKGWQKVASFLAAVVVFCTTYALILPAITMERNAVCGLEVHEHGEACYAQQAVYRLQCALEVPAGSTVVHTHDAACYDADGALACLLPEVAAHVHSDACYEVRELPCALVEEEGHVCSEECVSTEVAVICQISEEPAHQHGAECMVETDQTMQVLICQIPEHIHEDACYPLEATEPAGSPYLCATGVHAHAEACYDEQGNLICTIPEHVHEAACLVADLDLNADVETAADWERTMEQLQLTGDWQRDVLSVAESQLGYQESRKNCILENDKLKGYTRYGAWYGIPYGDWCAMFVSFCLDYAGVEDFPLESKCTRWIEALEAGGLYSTADTYSPEPGDLIFFDYDLRRDAQAEIEADHVGLVVELIPAAENTPAQIKTIEGNAGDDKVSYMTYELNDEAIIGYGLLPENPLNAEMWAQAEAVSAMLQALPAVEDAQAAFQTLNDEGDKTGYEALRQDITARIEAINEAYNALTDLQKERIGSTDLLTALQELCGGISWQEFPTLNDDGAVVSGLTVDGTEVIPGVEETDTEEAGAEEADSGDALSEYTVRSGDAVRYHFTATTQSYYTDLSYGKARVKVELVLPLTREQAEFDTEAMTWLEDSQLTVETRSINGIELSCQVLTGYKQLTGDTTGIVVPCSFTETVTVRVLDMVRGEEVAVLISAAMEHGAWDDICATHGIAEKLTIATDVLTVSDPLIDEDHGEVYLGFQARIEEIAAMEITQEEKHALAEEVMKEAVEVYLSGGLTTEELDELGNQLREVMLLVAEYATGIAWMFQVVNGPVGTAAYAYPISRSVEVSQTAAIPPVVYAQLYDLDDKTNQIINEGGGLASDDGAVYVSKTIERTELENVFDITLQVGTQDEIIDVYKDPDMAVVVVMDVSYTMNSTFDGQRRYMAAMDAASNFLNQFAEATNGISEVGFVAFNTSAHEIFEMQQCNDATQAAALISEMESEVESIMTASGYANAATRFTNIQAGLKMAEDWLVEAGNEHKYIVFISDGYPTTYISSGYTGYDPNNSGSNRNRYGTSMFYDNVRELYCSYGTSYSDTAAIKAREIAAEIKAAGTNIFSIGVDLAGQSIEEYLENTGTTRDPFSIVERRDSTYEIHGDTVYDPGVESDFKEWLQNDIGSGYYYDCNDTAGLQDAFDTIFQTIQEINAASAHLDWITTDPMGNMGVGETDSVEFIGFWDLDGELQDELVGQSGNGPEYENTATFDLESNTIHWDLKNSGYIGISFGLGTSNYSSTLKYRVRLLNEEDAFIDSQEYDTNDVTYLTYRIIEVQGDTKYISEQRSIEFPIPSVRGYLSELSFLKTDPVGRALVGAEFTLSHDTANCGFCRGDGASSVPLENFVEVSGEDGMVTFTEIPSGHHYVLAETKVPDGYIATKNTYSVIVAYDALTVTVTDADGNELEWSGSIANDMYYSLPNTGGMGTSHFTFGGLLILAAAALMYSCNFGRKRRKGGR